MAGWTQTTWEDDRIREDDGDQFRGTKVLLEFPDGSKVFGRVTMKGTEGDPRSMARIATAFSGDTYMFVADAVLSIWTSGVANLSPLRVVRLFEEYADQTDDPAGTRRSISEFIVNQTDLTKES
jgi:hypothetical protein